MIAITFALPAESAGFIPLLRNRRRVARDGGKSIAGEIHEQRVTVLHTGVGEKSCRATLGQFLGDQCFDRLITAGFAGGLNDEICCGDLVLAENFSDPDSVDRARSTLARHNHRVGKLLTASRVIDSMTERAELARRSGALAVDMETEVIAEVCRAHALPMLSIRAITDTPAQPLPAPPEVLFNIDRQKTEITRLLFYLTRHPGVIRPLLAFARRVAMARRSLTSALDLLLRNDVLQGVSVKRHPPENGV